MKKDKIKNEVQRHNLVSRPFRAADFLLDRRPGRCPGLVMYLPFQGKLVELKGMTGKPLLEDNVI